MSGAIDQGIVRLYVAGKRGVIYVSAALMVDCLAWPPTHTKASKTSPFFQGEMKITPETTNPQPPPLPFTHKHSVTFYFDHLAPPRGPQ